MVACVWAAGSYFIDTSNSSCTAWKYLDVNFWKILNLEVWLSVQMHLYATVFPLETRAPCWHTLTWDPQQKFEASVYMILEIDGIFRDQFSR